MTLPRPSIAVATIKRAARHCLDRIALLKKVRLIGVRLSGFVPVGLVIPPTSGRLRSLRPLTGRVEQPRDLLRLAQVVIEVDGVLRRQHMHAHALLLQQLERLGTDPQPLQHTL